MAIALKTDSCPCCSEKLNITILLKEGDCTDAWLSPKRSVSIDSWYDDAYLYDDDPYEDRYDPYEDRICSFCNGNCYGRCDYEAEMGAAYWEAGSSRVPELHEWLCKSQALRSQEEAKPEAGPQAAAGNSQLEAEQARCVSRKDPARFPLRN